MSYGVMWSTAAVPGIMNTSKDMNMIVKVHPTLHKNAVKGHILLGPPKKLNIATMETQQTKNIVLYIAWQII